jgi:hypothetical protein
MKKDIVEKIRRFHDLHEEVKPAMKELAVLREFFLELAGGEDAVFNDTKNKIEIVITREEQTRVDLKKLRLEHAELLKCFEATLEINKVTCRKSA